MSSYAGNGCEVLNSEHKCSPSRDLTTACLHWRNCWISDCCCYSNHSSVLGFCLVYFPPFFPWLLRVLLCCQMSNLQNLIIRSPLNSFQAESIVRTEKISVIMNIIVGGSSSLFWLWCLIETMGAVAICRQTFVKGLEPFVKWLEEAEEED